MIPILATQAMRDADAVAVRARGTDALVNAAGTAVALEAKRMLRSCYGKRVAVVVGPGLNGADGRVAARWLRARGARVDVVDVATQPERLDHVDLVIDAAFGLGCSRPYDAPRVDARTKVLAVDLVSGVDADTGAILGRPLRADVTLAIGAVKPAHLTGPAARLTGELRFAGIGIVDTCRDGLVEDRDLDAIVRRGRDDHKWHHAVSVLAGSTSMPGAAALVVRGAIAAGASMVRLSSRGDVAALVSLPPEVVHADEDHIDQRSRSVVAGPGLGADAPTWLASRLKHLDVPVVLDADGLARSLVDTAPRDDTRWILTPHEGEFSRLFGASSGDDRFAAVRALARDTGCVVLLKGPTTIVADPSGTMRVVTSGTETLASAGTGDVLSGIIGATLARGHAPLDAAALGAHLHGRAGARLGVYEGASEIPAKVVELLTSIAPSHR